MSEKMLNEFPGQNTHEFQIKIEYTCRCQDYFPRGYTKTHKSIRFRKLTQLRVGVNFKKDPKNGSQKGQ